MTPRAGHQVESGHKRNAKQICILVVDLTCQPTVRPSAGRSLHKKAARQSSSSPVCPQPQRQTGSRDFYMWSSWVSSTRIFHHPQFHFHYGLRKPYSLSLTYVRRSMYNALALLFMSRCVTNRHGTSILELRVSRKINGLGKSPPCLAICLRPWYKTWVVTERWGR